MGAQFSLFDLLVLLGILQGFITSILLLNSKKNVQSNKFLALILLSFCLLSFKSLLHTLGLWDTQVFRFFPNALEVAISPLVFFYIKSLVTPSFSFKPKYWSHFIPFFLSQTYAFTVYFWSLSAHEFDQKDAIANRLLFDDVKQLDEFILMISLVCYLYWGYRELQEYKQWLNNTTSDGTYPDFAWMNSVFILSVAIGLMLLFNHALDFIWNLKNRTLLHWNLLTLFFSFVIYYLGLRGYFQPNISFTKKEVETKVEVDSPAVDENYANTVQLLQKALEEDRVFLDPKLSIYKLAESLNVPQKHLSQVINQHFKVSFRELINGYRVEEVKAMLQREDTQHLSILGIALECGFNSEATFYRIFKKSTQKSPKEYRQNSA